MSKDKIELIFIHIKKHRNLSNLDILLNPNFQVEVIEGDDKCDINAIYSYRYPSIFNDNITNINALIGKNNIGKTNILELLGSNELEYTDNKDSQYAFVYYNWKTQKYIIQSNLSYVLKQDQERFINHLFSMSIKYFSVGPNVNRHLFTTANGGSSGRYGFNSKEDSALYYKHFYLTNNTEENYGNNFGYIEFEITRDLRAIREENYINLLPSKFPGKGCGFDHNHDKNTTYKKAFLVRLVECCINFNEKYCHDEFEDINAKIRNISKKNIEQNNYYYNEYIDLLISLERMAIKNNYSSHVTLENLEKVYKDNFFSCVEKLVDKCDHSWFKNSHSLRIPFDSINDDMNILLNNFFERCDTLEVSGEFIKSVIDINFIGLSTGLSKMLNLYSGIYTCFNQGKEVEGNNIVLLLDEPDENFHPEWSRMLIFSLNKFLKNHFSEYNIQIIVSSHSPFVMSDLPEDNIVLLDLDENTRKTVVKKLSSKTFGADIHSLLINTFFMKSTIGEFSKQHINNLINKVQDNPKKISYTIDEINEIYDLINMIGEPLLRKKLFIEFNKRYKENSSEINTLKERVNKLEIELSILKGGKNDTN